MIVPGLLLFLLPLIAGPQLSAQTQPTADLPSIFSSLEGAWEGIGVLFGRPATFELVWEIGATGFVHLSFSIASVEEGGSSIPALSARATYWVEEASVSGVWIDDRPQRLMLDAAVTDSSVVTNWSAEAEDGRTEYLLRSPTSLVVRDFVRVDGANQLFAEATYQRRSVDPRQ